MASSRASAHLKKTTSISSSPTSPDEIYGRRAAKPSALGSPQRETTVTPQRKPLIRPATDSAAKVGRTRTPPQTAAVPAAANKSRTPGAARKPAEKPPSPSRQPLKSPSTTNATAKAKTPKPATSTASRVVASSKPGSVSEKAIRAPRAGVGGAQSTAKVRSPARNVVTGQKASSTSAADATRRAASIEEPSVTTDPVHLVVTCSESHVSGEKNGIVEGKAETKEETVLTETDEAIEEENINLESQRPEQHGSPEQNLDGSRVLEISDEEPPADESIEQPRRDETEGANLTMTEPRAVEVEETGSDVSPAAESTTEKIEAEADHARKAPAPARAEPRRAALDENGGEAAPTLMVFKKPTFLQAKKKEEKVSNDVIEETWSKLLEKRKSKVRALVGAFETVISLQDEGQPGQSPETTSDKEPTDST
ncbi:neurofilament heavy polypeptide-like [Zingiber officinale]|uniref:Calmodulin-binding domain-containing protein n=1 Tax=Zingiber officinale TaxID=94328 RepID=A0A8J5FCC1_ZINOF|nr:neurofilament heavy polypeptide-like [Zingiber officinale]XP_042429997.1 neurofilament heavy polypeptide-like [Zingiber officinale]KAG6484138.1 hypothetical protein ZIOFF_060932 [Zingiber officinale]